jgi:sigma-B regulation protein RsbU (phosphoserine phosphatase)
MWFATVFFGILDIRDGSLLYTNAGHTTGTIVGRGVLRELPSTGPILGAIPEPVFEQRFACLGACETLFLCTDGITEARRGSELFGEQRLFALLREVEDETPDELNSRVLHATHAFSAGARSDDVALLAVRRAMYSGPANGLDGRLGRGQLPTRKRAKRPPLRRGGAG